MSWACGAPLLISKGCVHGVYFRDAPQPVAAPCCQARWPGTHSPALPTLYSRRTHARTRSAAGQSTPTSLGGGSFQAPLERPTAPHPWKPTAARPADAASGTLLDIHPRVSITPATSCAGPTALHGHPLQPPPGCPCCYSAHPTPTLCSQNPSWKQLTKHFQIPMPLPPSASVLPAEEDILHSLLDLSMGPFSGIAWPHGTAKAQPHLSLPGSCTGAPQALCRQPGLCRNQEREPLA